MTSTAPSSRTSSRAGDSPLTLLLSLGIWLPWHYLARLSRLSRRRCPARESKRATVLESSARSARRRANQTFERLLRTSARLHRGRGPMPTLPSLTPPAAAAHILTNSRVRHLEQTLAPMTERRDATLAPVSLEPDVLANISPTLGQRRMARGFLLALLSFLLVTWPFATVKLPEVDAFVPTVAAALFVSDCVTAALLVAQFSVLRQWALLVIASGYLFSALTVVAHALAFPGAFTSTGVLGSGLQSAVWLYWFWHSGLPLAIIGYALLKDTDRLADVHSTRLAIILSVAGVVSLVIGLFWFVTQHQDLLPITFTDVRPLSLFRRIIGGVVVLALGGIALWLLWRRQRSLLDQWFVRASARSALGLGAERGPLPSCLVCRPSLSACNGHRRDGGIARGDDTALCEPRSLELHAPP